LKQQPPQRHLLHVDDGCAFSIIEIETLYARRAAWTAGGLYVVVIAAVPYEYGKEPVERSLNVAGEI
jgi:hypothetical protein